LVPPTLCRLKPHYAAPFSLRRGFLPVAYFVSLSKFRKVALSVRAPQFILTSPDFWTTSIFLPRFFRVRPVLFATGDPRCSELIVVCIFSIHA
jgi:hypothetical protein